MTKNTGGSAFPDPGRAQSQKQREVLTETGMSLRDYFAAKAITGILSGGVASEDYLNRISDRAYFLADAMLKARDKV